MGNPLGVKGLSKEVCSCRYYFSPLLLSLEDLARYVQPGVAAWSGLDGGIFQCLGQKRNLHVIAVIAKAPNKPLWE